MKKAHYILLFIFAITLATRLIIAFSSDGFSYDAYLNLRRAEYAMQTGSMLIDDPLSYGGRSSVYLPVFHYLLSFFSLFLPLEIVGKLIPSIFLSSVVFIVYLISKKITDNEEASLFSSFVAGFIPILFSTTLNNVSSYSLTLPLFFLLLYLFIIIREVKVAVHYFIITLILLVFTSAASSMLILSFIFYIVLILSEKMLPEKHETELIIFSTFTVIITYFLIYKNALLTHGPAIIWQNIPAEILNKYFFELTALQALYAIGILPLLFGVYAIYHSLFVERRKDLHLLISFALTVILILWFKLVRLDIGLIMLGIVLTILFSYAYKKFFSFIGKTVTSRYRNAFFAGFLVIVILTSVVPSITSALRLVQKAPSENEIAALLWANENTDENETIAATVAEGHLLNYYSKRKNIADLNFLLERDARQRVDDTRTIYTTTFETTTISLMNKYHSSYLYLSENSISEYGIDKSLYLTKRCFDLVYDQGIRIYHLTCRMESI